jgi:PPOX class probable F420-dependent enzyme
MASGRCSSINDLPEPMRALLERARRAGFATVDASGAPHLVPIAFAIRGDEIVMEVDDKPKESYELARTRNVRANPNVALLVDEWDEDWTRLAWVMVRGHARVEETGSATALLRAKYPQYEETALKGPVIALTPRRINWWRWT